MSEARIFYVGRGNSVVLRLGESDCGRYGIIDCYQGDDGSHPLLSYLRNVQVSAIEFIIITHPHRDHFGGIGALLREYGSVTKKFCDCGVDPQQVMVALYNSCDEREKKAGEDLEAIRKFCAAKKHQHKVFSISSPGMVIYEDKTRNIVVDSVAPVGFAYKRTQESLERYFERCRREWTKAKGDSEVEFRLPSPKGALDLNHLSSAIRVRLGEKTFLFGGDVLKYNWQLLLRSSKLPADVVLLSHHGSHTGFPASAWGDSFAGTQTTALISGEGFHQPSPSVVEHLTARQARVVATGSALVPLTGNGLRGYVANFHHKLPKPTRAKQDIVLRVLGDRVDIETHTILSFG
jgi:beta-lactamase superfamily II metal-dependent hydrolase